MADSSLERKKKLVAEFEQVVRNWPSGKPGIIEVIEYLEKEKKNLEAMKRRRKKKKEKLSEKEILKFAERLGYEVEPKEPKQNKQASKPKQIKDNVVEMWRDKDEADVASARSKQASAKRR